MNLYIMKKLLLIIPLVFYAFYTFAQSYRTEYYYDYAGNRIARRIIVLSIAAPYNLSNSHKKQESAILDKWINSQISLYPNPTKGKLQISISNGNNEIQYTIKVYTLSGKSIVNQNLIGNGTSLIDLANYPNGAYLLYISTDNKEKQYKILKQ